MFISSQSFNNARVAKFGSGATILRARGDEALTIEQLQAAAPSVFAEGAHDSRSERYTYIPTIEVLRGLMKEGFSPYEVRQGGSRDEAKRGFTKHLLRLRHASQGALVAGDSKRELVLLNAHDGTSSYQLMSGLFRMVCSNGLITCDAGQMQKVAHKGDIVHNVIEGAYRVIEDGEAVEHQVNDMRALQLSSGEQQAFAAAALELRFNDKNDNGSIKPAPIEPEALLRAKRADDVGNDMWKTFNRVQEHVMTGGGRYIHRAANGRRSYRETRPVQSIDGNVTLNRALWVLASKMQELKAA